VYSKYMMPGELVKVFMHKGKKYVRIAFTNRVKFTGTIPVTDVLYSNVTGIRKLPSSFKKMCFGVLKMKPKAVYYQFKK
jgi:hypothetical protein